MNILLLDGGKEFGHSHGELNHTLHKKAKEVLTALGHNVKETAANQYWDTPPPQQQNPPGFHNWRHPQDPFSFQPSPSITLLFINMRPVPRRILHTILLRITILLQKSIFTDFTRKILSP